MAYTTGWLKPMNPNFKCKHCSSDNCRYRKWETFDESHEDLHIKCFNCNKEWWIEGSDY